MRNGKTKLSEARTYDEAATYMLNAWIQSEFHRENMPNTFYEITAIASYFNPKDQSLTAVQVFVKM